MRDFRLWGCGLLLAALLSGCPQVTPPPATPGSLSTGVTAAPAVVLSWGAAERAAGYELERKAAGGDYAALAAPGPDTTTYTDTTVAFGTTYAYRVRATGAGGVSGWLERANVTTPAQPTQAPGAPQNLTASAAGPARVSLTWQAPAGGGAVALYRIQRRTGASGGFSDLGTSFTPGHSDTSVGPDTTYTYQVRAENGAGHSAYVVSGSVTTPAGSAALPGSPQGVLAWATTSASARVQWQAPTAGGAPAGYTLERRTADGAYTALAANIQELSYSDNTVSGATTYTYRVRAVNGAGHGGGAESNPVPVPAPCASGAAEAEARGCFGPVVTNWPVVPTFSALLPNGRVIGWYASDDIGRYRERTDVHQLDPRNNPPKAEDGTLATVWDPAGGGFQDASFGNGSAQGVSNAPKGTDLFCAGFTVLSDGRFFTAGGDMGLQWGSIRLNIYDPIGNAWEQGPGPKTPDMWRDRWYPTVTQLPSGQVLITGGTAKPDPGFVEGSASTPNNPCRTPSGNCPAGLAQGAPGGLTVGINSSVVNTAYNNAFEVYDPATGGLRMLNANASAIASFEHYYPWWHVAPNGLAFLSGAGKQKAYLDVGGDRWFGPWESTSYGIPYDAHRVYGTSVMYEPGRVMVMGGGYAADQWVGSPAQRRIFALNNTANGRSTIHIALSSSSSTPPTLTQGPAMRYSRTHLNATLLADGRVFVNGGQQDGGENPGPIPPTPMSVADSEVWWPKSVNPGTVWNPDLAVLASEIWTPGPNGGSFAPGPRAQRPRIYHSVAMLLPDATVLTAGGGGCGLCAGNIETGLDPALYGSAYNQPERINQKNHEIYYPAYLFKPDGGPAQRPVITGLGNTAPSPDAYPTVAYDGQFSVGWSHPDPARSVGRVTLVALGVPTHAFNQNQRFLSLDFSAGGQTLTVKAPHAGQYGSPTPGGARNIAPPGFYMLFVLDDLGVPSVARILRVA